jgi:aryl-alcohol dehydrogenase-like predicted oxidoreductase
LGDVEVARVGLGTNQLTNTPERVAFIKEAVASGLNHIDTAHTYTDGESEQTIGAAFSPKPDGCILASKGGYAPGHGRPEILRAQIDESLRRLRTEAIDLYYLHRVDPETPFEDSVGALAEARAAGKVRHIGLSKVDVDQIERARAIAPIAAVQNHYNLSERGSDDVIDHCAREGIVFVPYYPLEGGDERALEEIAEGHDTTPMQIRLAWLLHRSPMTLPIPGTLSLEHLRQNLAALDIELTGDEFEALSGGS